MYFTNKIEHSQMKIYFTSEIFIWKYGIEKMHMWNIFIREIAYEIFLRTKKDTLVK